MASATAMATAEQPGARDPTPHVYTIAKKAYTSLVDAMALSLEEAKRMAEEWGVHTDQSVLISGESGEGKTEAAACARVPYDRITTASSQTRGPLAGADPSALAVLAAPANLGTMRVVVRAAARSRSGSFGEASPVLEA